MPTSFLISLDIPQARKASLPCPTLEEKGVEIPHPVIIDSKHLLRYHQLLFSSTIPYKVYLSLLSSNYCNDLTEISSSQNNHSVIHLLITNEMIFMMTNLIISLSWQNFFSGYQSLCKFFVLQNDIDLSKYFVPTYLLGIISACFSFSDQQPYEGDVSLLHSF